MVLAETVGHIFLDEQGRAWIDDTRVKVIEIVMDHVGNGWSAEEIHRQYPHISLAQAHAALAYYYDHKAAFDRAMDESLAKAKRLWAENLDSPFHRKLRAMGLVR